MKKRIVLILLSLFMMILSSSCRKAAGTLSPSSPHEGSVESEAPSSPGSRVLTNIYRSQVFPLPEGETMDIFVLPEWDGEVLRYVSVRYIHEKDADGNDTVSRIWSFVESDAKQIASKKELDFDRPGIPRGVIHGNGQNMTFPCSNSKPGCVLALNDYYNNYSCAYCGSVEIDSNGTTHNHGYHTVCHITILCEYAY